ncbi:MAG TPA: hypothetical protein VF627_09585 [Abditibacterium sp.]|jgi:alginate O-acetyltransferase complex protein AlgJ
MRHFSKIFLAATIGLSSAWLGIESSAARETAEPSLAASFRAKCASLAKSAEKKYEMTVRGTDGWLFFASELRHVGAGQFWGEAAAKASQSPLPHHADPLPAILDFKAQLEKSGVELLLVPVPPKALVYPEALLPSLKNPPRLDEQHQQFTALLRENGVEVLDLMPDFLAHRAEAAGPVYLRQDTHWSGRGAVFASRRIAEVVKAKPWFGAVPKVKWASEWKRQPIEGDLWLGLTGKQPPREVVPLRFVGTRAASAKTALKPVPINRQSPILLLGDSHDLVFHEGGDMHARGAGLPDQLALDLGFAVDLIAVRGSGATPARSNLMRRVRADANYLGRKKLVIWCFSAREFTETMGWQKVPVVKPK